MGMTRAAVGISPPRLGYCGANDLVEGFPATG